MVAESRRVAERPSGRIGSGYKEALTGRFGTGTEFSHSFVPVTESGWSPDRPVRPLIDTGGDPLSTARPYLSDAGLLLRGELPVFVRAALEKKGLSGGRRCAGSFERPRFRSNPLVGFGGIFAPSERSWVCWLVLVLPWARSKNQKELETIRPRVARYFFYAIGGALMLLSVCCSIPKAVHIAKAASTTGVITDTQESGNILSKYSFYVEARHATGALPAVRGDVDSVSEADRRQGEGA